MITYVPANIDIPWEGIENGAVFNDDGHGWAVASEKGLSVGKSMNYDHAALGLAVAREEHGPSSLVMFHSRFATHGTTNEFNIHPFYVDPDGETTMAHNGVLPLKYHPDHGDPRSDTRVFADTVASTYTDNGVPSRRGGKAMGSMIGSGNKLVFLTAKDGKPKVRIVNAHLGTFSGGVWYSNDGFRPSRFAGYGGGRFSSWSSSYDYGSAGSGSKTTNINGTITKSDDDSGLVMGGRGLGKDDCDHCGVQGSVDRAADICQACEMCMSCSQWMGDCVCYIPSDDYRDSVTGLPVNVARGRAVELWTPNSSPLNPQFSMTD
jgi:glutamine amidotransferase